MTTSKTKSKPTITIDRRSAQRFATRKQALTWIKAHDLKWPDAALIPADAKQWLV
jgi:hypothetical protein